MKEPLVREDSRFGKISAGVIRLRDAFEVVQSAGQRLRSRRVPVILQMSATECGAACLAMILSYYGRETGITECRDGFGVGRDGVTAKAIARMARTFGLRVKAYSLQGALSDFQYVPLPAIAHWDFNHFVVVEGWSPKEVQIIDPAEGRRKLTAAEWEAGFTGVVLTLEPGTHFERRRTPIQASWRTYMVHLLRIPGTFGILAQVIGASLFLQLLGLAVPLLTQVLVDQVLPFQISNIMNVLAIGMVILTLAYVVTSYLRSVLLIYLQARLDSQMMLGFFEHLLSLPFRFFQERTSGDLLMRLGSNATIRETLTSQTMSVVLDGLFVVGYLVILLLGNPIFAGLALGLALLQLALVQGTTRYLHTLTQRYLAASAESQSYLVEALAGIATLKASGAETRVFDRWSNLFFKELNLSLERSHLSALLETALTALRVMSPLILLWVGAQQVLAGAITVGTMLALNALAISFLTPLLSLATSVQSLQLVGAHLERLADVLEAEPEQAIQPERQGNPSTSSGHRRKGLPLQGQEGNPSTSSGHRREGLPLQGNIELKEVSFQYDPNAPFVVRDISVTIQPGQKVALVGKSGSGKSTLAKILLGLYKPTTGDICYDGTRLEELNYRSLRSQFGAVLQESFLFSGSIRENIAFNAPDASYEQIVEAAQQAAIHDDIMQMPMQYETLVAEGGSALSGGQRQRLSIARALASQPAILLLDEATSHLDVVTERTVDQNLSALASTRIVIAHRLSTIRNANLILMLHEGHIAERGTHDELLAQGGQYATLVHSQMETQTSQN